MICNKYAQHANYIYRFLDHTCENEKILIDENSKGFCDFVIVLSLLLLFLWAILNIFTLSHLYGSTESKL